MRFCVDKGFSRILQKIFKSQSILTGVSVEGECGDTFARLCDEVAEVGHGNPANQYACSLKGGKGVLHIFVP